MSFTSKAEHKLRAAGLALFAALLLAGCSNDPKGNDYVRYKGTNLIVEGQTYPFEATLDRPDTFLPGRLVLQPDKDHVDDAHALINRYGLTFEGLSKEGWLLVKVPDGFETQWATAFTMKISGRSYATVDLAISPTSIAAAQPHD